jgi:hypothetical protein
MLGLTKDEVRSDLAAHDELRCEGDRLSFHAAAAGSICIDLRVKEPHHLVYLARLVAHLEYEEIDFRHAQLWITTWGFWNPLEEAIGFKTLEQFRRSYGENRSLESAPGHYFRHNEFQESVCCLLQPMIVGWDAYYVPRWSYGGLDYFVAVSHDSFIDVCCRTQEMYAKTLEILKWHEWIRPLLRPTAKS